MCGSVLMQGMSYRANFRRNVRSSAVVDQLRTLFVFHTACLRWLSLFCGVPRNVPFRTSWNNPELMANVHGSPRIMRLLLYPRIGGGF